MRFLTGLILGAALLAIGVYISDTMSTPSASTTTTVSGVTIGQRTTIVNWDVAGHKWDNLKMRTREQWAKLTSG